MLETDLLNIERQIHMLHKSLVKIGMKVDRACINTEVRDSLSGDIDSIIEDLAKYSAFLLDVQTSLANHEFHQNPRRTQFVLSQFRHVRKFCETQAA
ncbi:hypothetical protein [Ferrimonas marina]|uniref:Uncharacterized protein n=1 Tax=Ferrimonas marina TaxID=299255 RepID=A0A1M5TAS0_9GAMM|nr:hypothetical protein [Ferrimonas marina]SHH47814.1 hypothetical protein SAMN02745129_2063 [Ferrimonas marina]